MRNPEPLLVLVSGPPGSGKTTLARRIAGDLNLPLIAKDAIKESLFETLGCVVNQQHWDRSGPERIVVMESQR